jgi:hypothetical protein
LVDPYPLPVTTTSPPDCTAISAISGLPTTIVETFSGRRMIVAWSSVMRSSSAASAGRGIRVAAASNTSAGTARKGFARRAIFDVIATLRTRVTAAGSALLRQPQPSFDCKMVNEVQMQRVRGAALQITP